jgi:hypothetical protein
MFHLSLKRRPQEKLPSEETTFWAALLAISLLFLLLGSYWFQHWYILWAVWPAALLPSSRFTRSVLPWLVFGGLAANFTTDFFLAAAPEPGVTLLNYSLPVLIIWGPALVAGCSLWISRKHEKSFKRAREQEMDLA